MSPSRMRLAPRCRGSISALWPGAPADTGGAATAGQYGSNFASALSVISDARGAVAVGACCSHRNRGPSTPWRSTTGAAARCTACRRVGERPVLLEHQPDHPVPVQRRERDGVRQHGERGRIDRGNGFEQVRAWLPDRRDAGAVANASRIQLMQQYAQNADVGAPNGDYDLISATNGSTIPGLRIEFVTIDVNGNGVIDWDEEVHARPGCRLARRIRWPTTQTGRRWYPRGSAPQYSLMSPNMTSQNCGANMKVFNHRRS